MRRRSSAGSATQLKSPIRTVLKKNCCSSPDSGDLGSIDVDEERALGDCDA